MTSTNQSAAAEANLEMKENNSIVVEEGMSTTRLITKLDGSKVPYAENHLRASLNKHVNGLNMDYINLDIIIQKVSSGLYNGKSLPLQKLYWASL